MQILVFELFPIKHSYHFFLLTRYIVYIKHGEEIDLKRCTWKTLSLPRALRKNVREVAEQKTVIICHNQS